MQVRSLNHPWPIYGMLWCMQRGIVLHEYQKCLKAAHYFLCQCLRCLLETVSRSEMIFMPTVSWKHPTTSSLIIAAHSITSPSPCRCLNKISIHGPIHLIYQESLTSHLSTKALYHQPWDMSVPILDVWACVPCWVEVVCEFVTHCT